MTEQADRLRALRVEAGFESARKAAHAMGVPPATYSQHESGTRGCTFAQFERYGIFFHTRGLANRLQWTDQDRPDTEVIAALVYDGQHRARRWGEASPRAMHTYRTGVEAALRATGINPRPGPYKPAQRHPGGRYGRT